MLRFYLHGPWLKKKKRKENVFRGLVRGEVGATLQGLREGFPFRGLLGSRELQKDVEPSKQT